MFYLPKPQPPLFEIPQPNRILTKIAPPDCTFFQYPAKCKAKRFLVRKNSYQNPQFSALVEVSLNPILNHDFLSPLYFENLFLRHCEKWPVLQDNQDLKSWPFCQKPLQPHHLGFVQSTYTSSNL